MKEKCDGCKHFKASNWVFKNPRYDVVSSECHHPSDDPACLCIRKLGRIDGPDEPWDPIPEIRTLLNHDCISEERRAAGPKWIRDPRNKNKLHEALRSLRIKINDAGGIPVLRPGWCPLEKDDG